eukprot:XP_003726023.1 PREDICTED: RNA-directed DNA polymerase from mobile element jockey-like [Strongylocentrotus purpuratus]
MDCRLENFNPVSQEDVLKIIKSSKVKSCMSDPIPAQVFRQCMEELLPAITDITNQSLQSGVFPEALKSSVIIPTLKKPSLDPDCLRNYRPISNLPYLGKIIERVACQQLMTYLRDNALLASRQSAYRPSFSVETALTRVQDDLLKILDDGNEAMLVLLDLSSAFDTVDHSILLKRLSASFGITGAVKTWLASYLEGREQRVLIDGKTSSSEVIRWGVPQGSVIGPLLFICYTTLLQSIAEHHNVECMMYADDLQLYTAMTPATRHESKERLELCITEIRNWMKDNKLVINDGKTEMLHLTSSRKRGSHQELSPLTVGDTSISSSTTVRDLGVVIVGENPQDLQGLNLEQFVSRNNGLFHKEAYKQKHNQ